MKLRLSSRDGLVGIRPFHQDDAASLFAAARESIDQLCQWMVWCPASYNPDDSYAFVCASQKDWEAGRKFSFLIFDRVDGAMLGSVGLSDLDHTHGRANVGYWVRQSRTGRGIATAAVRLAARFAFELLHLNRLEWVIAVGNQASIRVAEKLGAQREGLLRRRLIINRQPCDAVLYSLLATEGELNHDLDSTTGRDTDEWSSGRVQTEPLCEQLCPLS
jgi:RimJ/RimL family protein N-acetyltransferase